MRIKRPTDINCSASFRKTFYIFTDKLTIVNRLQANEDTEIYSVFLLVLPLSLKLPQSKTDSVQV